MRYGSRLGGCVAQGEVRAQASTAVRVLPAPAHVRAGHRRPPDPEVAGWSGPTPKLLYLLQALQRPQEEHDRGRVSDCPAYGDVAQGQPYRQRTHGAMGGKVRTATQ